jgi:hypothetical protein
MSGNGNYVNGLYVNAQTDQQLSKNDIFGVLQNERRRYMLKILREKGEQSVRSLSEEIAYLESGVREPKSNFRKSVYSSLHQTHIPKMEGLKIICYNRNTDTIELLPISHDFDVYIESVKKGDIPWSQFYLGLSVLASIGSIVIFAELIKWITGFQWMLFTNIVFIICSAVHVHYSEICKN